MVFSSAARTSVLAAALSLFACQSQPAPPPAAPLAQPAPDPAADDPAADDPAAGEPPTNDPAANEPAMALVVAGPNTVRGSVRARGRWCRGAAPRPGEMERATAWRPAGRQLLVRRGRENTDIEPVAEVSASGPEARFEVDLEPGVYCLVDVSKRVVGPAPPTPTGPRPANGSDPTCLHTLQRTCDAVVELQLGRPVPEVGLQFIRECGWGGGPCYRGSSPP